MLDTISNQDQIISCWEDIENPIVSICCMTYNHEDYIEEALVSFLSQETNFPFEILIHDDASTDKTANIIKKYEKKFSSIIKPIYQTVNQKSIYKSGMNPRFNFSRAQGKYIAICDGDDYWTDPFKLLKQVDFLETHPDFSMCFTSRIVVNDSGVIINKQIIEIDEWGVNDVVFGFIPYMQTIVARNFPGLTNFMLHQEYIGGDRLLAYFCSLHGKIKSFKDIMAAYRDNGLGIWSKYSNEDKMIRGFDSLISFHKIIGLPENNWAFLKQISNMQVALLSELFSNPKYVIKSNIIFRKRYHLPIWLYFYSIFIFLKRFTKKVIKSILGIE